MDPKSGMIRFLGRFFPGRLSKTTWVSPKSWWYMMLPRTGNLHLENDDRPWKFGRTLFSNQPLFKVVLILTMVSLSYFNHGFPQCCFNVNYPWVHPSNNLAGSRRREEDALMVGLTECLQMGALNLQAREFTEFRHGKIMEKSHPRLIWNSYQLWDKKS